MNFDLLYSRQQPFIRVKDGMLVDVNDMFLNLTGFKREELCGQSENKILENLFRTTVSVDFADIEKSAIIFTKAFEVRFVTVKKHIDCNDSITYIFKEIENSRLESKLLFIDKLIDEDVIGIGIFTALDFRLIKSNQTYLNYLPKQFNTKDAAYGKSIKEAFIEFEDSYFEEALRNIIKTNKSLYITEKQGLMLERDNSYWDSTITPICENGEVKYMVSMLHDVTERVLGREHIRIKNEEIERQNNRFQAIIECIDDIVTIFDKDGNYLKRNSVLDNIFGKSYGNFYEIAEIAKFYDFNGNSLSVDEFCTAKLLKGEKVKNQKCKMFNGEDEVYASYSGVPIFDENGDLEMGVMIAHDVTEIIKSSKEIENQKKLLESIIDNMNDGLIAIDEDGKTIKVNKAFKETLKKSLDVKLPIEHVSQSQNQGQKYYDEEGRQLSSEEFPAMRVLRGEYVDQQRVVIEHDSRKVYVDFNCTPIFDESGKFQFGIILRHDITEIIEKENKIKEQQELLYKSEKDQRETLEKALAMKDEFLSLISHEFRTPLNVINTAIQAIEYICGHELSDKTKKYLGMIRQNTFRQLRLVNNLLDITRINAGSIKINKRNIDIVFLTKAITESVHVYAFQKGVDLKFISSLDKKIIGTDDEKYERILLNLLSNAIKFTPEGKSIAVTLSLINGEIIIDVTDNGIGIPADKLDVIFERFGQVDSSLSRQAEGTGIGLSLVKKFVEALDGNIIVNSKLGEGTNFRILLKDEKIIEKQYEHEKVDLLDNRLIQTINVEFSDIYL